MRKSLVVQMTARRLGVRPTRLTSLVQRLADSGMVHTSNGPPYADVTPIEAARMLIIALVDTGLAAAPATIELYGQLRGRGSNLESAIAHALARPESLPPARSGLEMHTDSDSPYALLTTVSADGATTNVFGQMPETESVDRLVTVSGCALYGIAQELSAGMSAAEVDALLGSVN
jgi:hypothetical protein